MANSYEQEVELQEMFVKRSSLFDKMNSNVRGMLGMMQQMGKAMEKVGSEDTVELFENINQVSIDAAENMGKYGDQAKESFEEMEEGLSVTQKLMRGMYGDLEKIGKKGLVWATMAAGLTGFGKGLKLSANVMGSLWNITKNTVASVGHFAASILSFPFKILDGLMGMAQQGGGDNGLRQALEDIRKEFGDLRTGASAAIIDISRSMRGPLAESGLNARRIFGNLTDALKYFQEIARNMGPIFNLISSQLTASGEAAQRFGAYLKGLGLDTAESQKAIARMSVTSGQDINELGREITTFAYGMGEAFGFNGKEISRDIGKMMSDFDNFGNMSIQSLSQVSIYARKLGIDIEKLKGIVTSFDDFEKAAEGAANLSQAFGLNLDAFALIQEQDPAARMEQIRQSFFAAGRSVENMTRQERALLAEQTGLDQESLSLAFSQRSQATSYAEIQRQSDATKKKQLSQAEAMEKLSNSIERMVKSGSSLQGGFFKIFLDGFTAGIMRSREFRGLMRDLRQDMRIVFREGREVGRMFVESFPGVQDMLGGLRDIFNPAAWRTRMAGVSTLFRTFFSDLGDPAKKSGAFGRFVDGIKRHFSDLFNPQAAAGQRFLNGLKSFMAAFASIFVGGLRYAITAVTTGLRKITEFIRDPAAAIANARAAASGAASGAGGFLMTNLIIPLMDAFRELGPQLWEALSNLFTLLWSKIKPKLMEALPALAAVLFGPAVLNGLFSTAATALAGVFARIFGSVLLGAIRGAMPQAANTARTAASEMSDVATRAASSVPSGAGAQAEQGINAVRTITPPLGEVSQAAAQSPVNPAATGKLMTMAVVLGAVVVVVAGIIALAYVIKNTSLTPGDIAMSIGVILGATLIVGALTLMTIGLTAASPAGAAAPALIPVVAALALLGAAIALGMVGLATIIKGTGLTAGDVGLSILVVGGAVLVLAAVAAGAVVLAAAGIGTLALPLIAVGIVAMGLFAYALVVTTNDIITITRAIDAKAVALAAAKIGSTLLVFGGLATLAVALAAAGVVGSFAAIPIIAGMRLINGFAHQLVDIAKRIITQISTIEAPDSVRAKVDIVVRVMGAIGSFITSIGRLFSGGTSAWGAVFGDSTIEGQIEAMADFVQMLTLQIPPMVQKLVEAANSVQSDAAGLQKTQVIVQIMTSISRFIGAIAGVMRSLPEGGNQGAMLVKLNRFIDRTKAHMITLITSIAEVVQGIVTSANNIDPALAANVPIIAGAVTSILTSLSGFFIGILRSNAIKTLLAGESPVASLQAVRGLFSGIIGALTTGDNNFFATIGTLVTTIANSANIDPAKAANLYNITRILEPIFGAMTVMMNLINSLGPELLSGSEAEIAAKVLAVQGVIQGIATGFGSSIGPMIQTIITGLTAIDVSGIAAIVPKIDPIKTLFDGLKSLMDTITTFGAGGSSTGSGEAAVNAMKTTLMNTYDAIVGGSTKGGWSLFNFLTFLQPNIDPLAAIITATTAGTTVIASSIGTLAGNMTSILSSLDAMNTAVEANATVTRSETINRVAMVIHDYSTMVSMINTDLNSLARTTGDITVGLTRVRNRLGLGGSQSRSLTVGAVNVSITVKVDLSVDDIEHAIATRANGSTFAISNDAGHARISGQEGGTNANQSYVQTTSHT